MGMLFLLGFLAGLLICNAIPHLAAGLRGETFPTPFARPRGVGLSSPVLNLVWGWANLMLGLAVLPPLHHVPFLGFALGFLLAGLYLASHFGKVRAGTL